LEAWDECVKLDGPLYRDAGLNLPLFVGVDASTKRDSTALVAVTYQNSVPRGLLRWSASWTSCIALRKC
jgi:hypothetical protein